MTNKERVLEQMINVIRNQVNLCSGIKEDMDEGTLTILIASKINHLLFILQGKSVTTKTKGE